MISAVIATRNDPLLQATIDSLRGYAKQVIVIDDASDMPVIAQGADIIQRNSNRVGPGLSRHLGVDLASEEWIMFCDSHMDFPDNWYKLACDHLDSSQPDEIWGAVYRSNILFDSFWHDTRLVGGADFYFWRHHDLQFSFGDLTPRRPLNECEYTVPCLLGGCYFIRKDWFRLIGGFLDMIGYGSEEAWLSWSTWLRGGRVSIMGDLPVTHIFTKGSVIRRSLLPEWEINRLVVLRRILSSEEFGLYCSWLPISNAIKDDVERRCRAFTHQNDRLNHHNVCQSFNLQTFDEAIELMREYNSDMLALCPVCRDRRWLLDASGGMTPCPKCNPGGRHKPKVDRFELKKVAI